MFKAKIALDYFHLDNHKFTNLKGKVGIFQCLLLRYFTENEAEAVGMAEFQVVAAPSCQGVGSCCF